MYYLQSRYYNPTIGRFINADDPGYLGVDGTPISYNLFVYCGNNPVMGSDPSGCWDWGGVLVGVAIVAVGVAIIGLTVATAGAASPLAAATIASIGTATGLATIETGASITAAAATDSVAVLDFSVTDGVANQKYGYSAVIDFGADTAELYSHYGVTSSSAYGFSYGSGIVFNYTGPGAYGGDFIDLGASVNYRGMDYGIDVCWDPLMQGTAAVMGTVGFSLPPLRNASPVVWGYDYYTLVGSWGW